MFISDVKIIYTKINSLLDEDFIVDATSRRHSRSSESTLAKRIDSLVNTIVRFPWGTEPVIELARFANKLEKMTSKLNTKGLLKAECTIREALMRTYNAIIDRILEAPDDVSALREINTALQKIPKATLYRLLLAEGFVLIKVEGTLHCMHKGYLSSIALYLDKAIRKRLDDALSIVEQDNKWECKISLEDWETIRNLPDILRTLKNTESALQVRFFQPETLSWLTPCQYKFLTGLNPENKRIREAIERIQARILNCFSNMTKQHYLAVRPLIKTPDTSVNLAFGLAAQSYRKYGQSIHHTIVSPLISYISEDMKMSPKVNFRLCWKDSFSFEKLKEELISLIKKHSNIDLSFDCELVGYQKWELPRLQQLAAVIPLFNEVNLALSLPLVNPTIPLGVPIDSISFPVLFDVPPLDQVLKISGDKGSRLRSFSFNNSSKLNEVGRDGFLRALSQHTSLQKVWLRTSLALEDSQDFSPLSHVESLTLVESKMDLSCAIRLFPNLKKIELYNSAKMVQDQNQQGISTSDFSGFTKLEAIRLSATELADDFRVYSELKAIDLEYFNAIEREALVARIQNLSDFKLVKDKKTKNGRLLHFKLIYMIAGMR